MSKRLRSFEQARTLDPGFAAAHAEAANFWLNQLDVTTMASGLVDLPPSQMEVNFAERIRQAIKYAAATPAERAGYEAPPLRWSCAGARPLACTSRAIERVGEDSMR